MFSRTRKPLMNPVLPGVLAALLAGPVSALAPARGGSPPSPGDFDVLVIVLLIEILNAALAGVPDVTRRVAALVIALGGVGWVGVARLVRALVLQAREELWVESARALGLSSRRILLRHVLPNVAGPILVVAAFQIPTAILTESTLSFIGLGVQPPGTDWGLMVSGGQAGVLQGYVAEAFSAGLCIVVVVVAFNLLGERLADRSPEQR